MSSAFKLDENLSGRHAAVLTRAGHDVSTVASQRMCGTPDEDLITACVREGRCLVTLDLDFANPLRFPPRRFAGIAVLRLPSRPGRTSIDELMEALVRAVDGKDLCGNLWIVERDRVRVYQDPANDR